MPKPEQKTILSDSALQAELDALVRSEHFNQIIYTEEQKSVILYARENGISWIDLSKLFKSKNWRGFALGSLRAEYSRLTKEK